MKLTINTVKFQNMLSKALKCAGEVSDLPLTELILIKLNDGELSLTTTDYTNYMVVKEQDVQGDNFEVVVRIKTFSSLISKLTSDEITLDLKANYLEVVGNGTYKIEIMLDENGKTLKFPNPNNEMPKDNLISTISSGVVAKILNGLRQSIYILDVKNNELDKPYTKYQVGTNVMASNAAAVSVLDVKVFNEYKALTTSLMNILGVIDDEQINIYSNTKLNNANIEVKELAFESEHYSVYGLEAMDGKDFPYDSLNAWLTQSFSCMCKLPKNAITQLLGRITLFVEEYDSDAITLTFTNDSLNVSSRTLSGVEAIKFMSVENPKDFTCLINSKQLDAQIKALPGDVVNVYYGDDNAVKFVADDLTTVVALGE